jgi:hypothetical protein
LSETINSPKNKDIRKELLNVVNSDQNNSDKSIIIKTFLYKLIDDELFKIFEKTQSDKKIKDIINSDLIKSIQNHKVVEMVDKLPDLSNYRVKNSRVICTASKNKNNKHCIKVDNKSYFLLNKKLSIEFVNIISNELINDSIKSMEIFKIDDYFVSDIVDYNRFKIKLGQKILKSSNFVIEKELRKMFKFSNLPVIGKRRRSTYDQINEIKLLPDNLMKNMGNYFIQSVVPNNLSIYRAYANVYTWFKQYVYFNEEINLGYYSDNQTIKANYFKSIIVDWLLNKQNEKFLAEYQKYMPMNCSNSQFVKYINKDVGVNTNGIVELYILHQKHNIPILICDKILNVMYLIENNKITESKKDKSIQKLFLNKKYLHIMINLDDNKKNIISLSAIYLPLD